MAVDPKDSRVLGVLQQRCPENNQLKLELMTRIAPNFPMCDCLIHDRNCSFENAAKAEEELKGIKYFPIDRFHGMKHCPTCKNSPQNVPRLERRLKGVNTSVSEQVFSWFRNYARILNEMKPKIHEFLVLYFCKLHNAVVKADGTKHLNPYSACNKKKNSTSYPCTLKRPASAPPAVSQRPASKQRT